MLGRTRHVISSQICQSSGFPRRRSKVHDFRIHDSLSFAGFEDRKHLRRLAMCSDCKKIQVMSCVSCSPLSSAPQNFQFKSRSNFAVLERHLGQKLNLRGDPPVV